MKSILICVSLIAGAFIHAQSFNAENLIPKVEPFSNCAAIFFKDRMLVDEYSPKGKCKIEQGVKGKLSLHTVELNAGKGKAVKQLEFSVGIKNNKTNTIWMYSSERYTEVDVESILAKCTLGDNIVFLTTDQEIALTHYEIEVLWKC